MSLLKPALLLTSLLLLIGCAGLNHRPIQVVDFHKFSSKQDNVKTCGSMEEQEQELCQYRLYTQFLAKKYESKIYELLKTRDERNGFIFNSTVGLIYTGVASSQPHVDVAKTLAGLGGYTMSVNQYEGLDGQANLYIGSYKAAMCLDRKAKILQKGLATSSSSSQSIHDVLKENLRVLSTSIRALDNDSAEAENMIKQEVQQFKNYQQLRNDLESIKEIAVSADSTLSDASYTLEGKLMDLKQTIIQRYLNTPPDLNAAIDAFKQHVTQINQAQQADTVPEQSEELIQQASSRVASAANGIAGFSKASYDNLVDPLYKAIKARNNILKLRVSKYITAGVELEQCVTTNMI